MNDTISSTIYTVYSFGFTYSCILLIIYFRCPLKHVSSYRYFFILAAIHDMTFSSTAILISPISANVQVIADISAQSFVGPEMIYFRANLFNIYLTPRNTMIVVAINLTLLLDYLFTIRIGFWPDEHFTQLVQKTIELPSLDIVNASYIGCSMEVTMNVASLAFVAQTTTIVVFLECLHVFCALRIYTSLGKSLISKKSQSMQRHMFILLLLQIFQAVCPAICIHIPFFAGTLFVLTGISTSAVITNVIAALLALYPFFNPLIIVTFVTDYRTFVITKLGLRKVNKQMNIFVTPKPMVISKTT
ncbi:7TM chemoreceptor [Ancylostoma caninum]|uniref:7TM chemoreceptor n=1 Tax=Ancylostoma caninum TaxID=29170 RepID=A0A368GPZ2_ANCCA|nr:7TM chemoreceptor [Ancylostoma caninum]